MRKKRQKREKKIEIEGSSPIRNAEWVKEDGLIKIKIKKFKGKIGNWFCHLLGRPTHITVNLDGIGSFVWERCDGNHSFEEILNQMEEKFDERGLDERLKKFLYQLERNGLILAKSNK